MTDLPDPLLKHAKQAGDPPTKADKEGALIAHLSVYVLHFIGPVAVFLIYKDESPYVKFHAMQAMLLYILLAIVAFVATIGITIIASFTCGIGSVLYVLLIPLFAVPLWPAWKAYEGDWDGLPGIGQFGR